MAAVAVAADAGLSSHVAQTISLGGLAFRGGSQARMPVDAPQAPACAASFVALPDAQDPYPSRSGLAPRLICREPFSKQSDPRAKGCLELFFRFKREPETM
jgi:hypothetical protein